MEQFIEELMAFLEDSPALEDIVAYATMEDANTIFIDLADGSNLKLTVTKAK